MPLKKMQFGAVEGMLSSLNARRGELQAAKEAWMRTAGVTAQDMLDNVGGRFTEVNAAFDGCQNQLDACHAQLTQKATQHLNDSHALVAQCAARYS